MPDAVAPPISRELIAKLPRTFGPTLNDQLKQWELLFPAEQRSLKAQLHWLSQLPADEFKKLLQPIFEAEAKMDLPRWDASTTGLSVRDAGALARSPHYPQWRAAVEDAFSKIDEGVAKSGALKRPPGVLICVIPGGSAADQQPLWPSLAKEGAWIALDQPFGQMLGPLATALAGRQLPSTLEAIEGTWIFECETALSPLAESTRAIVLSWTALAATRREFLVHLNTIGRNLRAVDQTNEDLKRVDIGRLLGNPIGSNPRLREFVRSLLLSGNGSLVFNNSFVQWGAAEALRRAQPQVLVASFGVRPKLKPFSSSVLFEDQTRANPVAEQEDPAGSMIDSLKLAEYVYLASRRVPSYEERSITLMAAAGLNRVLILGPERPAGGDLKPFLLRWLSRE